MLDKYAWTKKDILIDALDVAMGVPGTAKGLDKSEDFFDWDFSGLY